MSSREIERLRKKFIFVAMISIFLAMLFIGLTVNLSTFFVTRHSIEKTLDQLIENTEDADTWDYNYRISISDIFTAEYFRNACYVLSFDEDGNQVVYYSNRNNSEEEIKIIGEYAETLLNRRRNSGQYKGFYYKWAVLENNQTSIAFLEGSVIMSTAFRTLALSVILGVCGLIVTFFLVLHFSRRIVQPEVENAARQKQFITNASHELKTPLAVIRANTEMIEMLQGENEWTSSTIKQVDHMNGMIQNLVMITRSQEQEDRSRLSEIDVSKAVNESVDPYESLAAQSGIGIIRHIDPDIKIMADSSKIRQLAAILMDNAMKYCDENGNVTVFLSHWKSGKGMQLSIANDYAEGSQADCNRFFDRFYREDASHNIDKGGYGIGLSIAESICRQYGGEIRAEWKDGVVRFVCCLR